MVKPSKESIKFAALATDVAVFAIIDGKLNVLLIDVDRPPHFDHVPGLPGGLVKPQETAEEAVERIIEEKCELDPKNVYIEQLYTFSGVKRDPRGRVVAVAYIGLIESSKIPRQLSLARWVPVSTEVDLAYDHDEILSVALDRLRARIEYTNIIKFLLPTTFTLNDLQTAYEIVLGQALDKRNFRKKILNIDLVKPSGKKQTGVANRPAELYVFSKKDVQMVEVL